MNSNFDWQIKLSPKLYDELAPLFEGYLDYKKHDFPKYDTLEGYTTRYENGLELDAKICTSNDGDPLWTEAVLFQNGREVACSEIGGSLDEELCVEYENNTYTVRFTKSNVCTTEIPHEKGGPA